MQMKSGKGLTPSLLGSLLAQPCGFALDLTEALVQATVLPG